MVKRSVHFVPMAGSCPQRVFVSLCICVPNSFLNSYYHKLSENVWVWGSRGSRSGYLVGCYHGGTTTDRTKRKEKKRKEKKRKEKKRKEKKKKRKEKKRKEKKR